MSTDFIGRYQRGKLKCCCGMRGRKGLGLVLSLLFLPSFFAFSGTITGTIQAIGSTGPGGGAQGGKYESRRYKFLERIDYSALRDFVVYIDQPMTNTVPLKPLEVITQREGVFRPHVLPVMVGTTVEWPNLDDIFHNVFSISETKPFDLGLYKDPEVKRVKFDRPGRVDVFCSIHSKMSCIILVLENPFFAVSDARGRYVIRNVPEGVYKLKAWHERLPSQTQEIRVPKNGEVKVDFTLTPSSLPKY